MTQSYRIETVSESQDYCMVATSGYGNATMGRAGIAALTRGKPAPVVEDPRDFHFILDEDWGLELTDLLGCTNQMLMLRGEVAQALAHHLDLGPHELHPFRLMNPRGRVHSDDYVILNPLGTEPCLSWDHSEISYDPDYPDDPKKIFGVDRYVFSADKLPSRDLFRIPEDPFEYFVSQRFVDFVRQAGYSNFRLNPIDVV